MLETRKLYKGDCPLQDSGEEDWKMKLAYAYKGENEELLETEIEITFQQWRVVF